MSAGISPENEPPSDLVQGRSFLEKVDEGIRDIQEGRYVTFGTDEREKFVRYIMELAKRP